MSQLNRSRRVRGHLRPRTENYSSKSVGSSRIPGSRRDFSKIEAVLNLIRLLDDEKCFSVVRELRWPDGVQCPHCANPYVTKQGRDDTQQCRQRYRCLHCWVSSRPCLVTYGLAQCGHCTPSGHLSSRTTEKHFSSSRRRIRFNTASILLKSLRLPGIRDEPTDLLE